MTSQAAQTRLNVYSVASHQQPASEHFTLLGFRVGMANSMALVGLHLCEIMDLVGWKRSGAALPYFLLKEVVNPAGVAAKLADPRFDTGKGYKRFDTLRGFYQTLLAECLKSESRKKSVYYTD